MRGFRYSPDDLRIHLLFQELQGLSVDRPAYHALFERDVVDDFLPVWQALGEDGWVHLSDTQIEIIGDGVFYLPLIQNLLAHDRSEAMRKAKQDLVDHSPETKPVAAAAS